MPTSAPSAKRWGVVLCDPDEDGWPESRGCQRSVRNFFFHNVPGPDGSRRFVEEGLTTNVAYAEGRARGAMGIDYGEYRPGKNALLIGNFANEPDTFLTLDNPRKLLFSDAALAVAWRARAGARSSSARFSSITTTMADSTCSPAMAISNRKSPTFRQDRLTLRPRSSTGTPATTSGYRTRDESERRARPVRPLVGRGCAFSISTATAGWTWC